MSTAFLRLVRTQAFRIVLLYAVLFALSVTALLGGPGQVGAIYRLSMGSPQDGL